jgi:hypothetical protein
MLGPDPNVMFELLCNYKQQVLNEKYIERSFKGIN